MRWRSRHLPNHVFSAVMIRRAERTFRIVEPFAINDETVVVRVRIQLRFNPPLILLALEI
jgi:hypothetical protein